MTLKNNFLLITAVFLLCSVQLYAQSNPLLGTWKLLSAKGTDQSGKPYAFDHTEVKQIKIITPTHFMFITENTGDTTAFAYAGGGTYTIDGNRYIENLAAASWEGYEQNKTDYTYEVDGDQFNQKGTLTLSDGSQILIDETWQRVQLPAQGEEVVGTWNRTSRKMTDSEGKKVSTDQQQEEVTFIVTPTHWMWIVKDASSHAFKAAAGGTYTREGDRYYPKTEVASQDYSKPELVEVTVDLQGDKMLLKGVNKTQQFEWEDAYERVVASTDPETASQ